MNPPCPVCTSVDVKLCRASNCHGTSRKFLCRGCRHVWHTDDDRSDAAL